MANLGQIGTKNAELCSAPARLCRYALQAAGARAVYSTQLPDPGLLICPTQFEHATLYVLTSETPASEISFRDARSGKSFAGKLEAGRAALLLVSDEGEVRASYNWPARRP
jgi:hypothetical protein